MKTNDKSNKQMLEAVPESDEDVRDDFSSDSGENKGLELKITNRKGKGNT